jgi:hypothetical protein
MTAAPKPLTPVSDEQWADTLESVGLVPRLARDTSQLVCRYCPTCRAWRWYKTRWPGAPSGLQVTLPAYEPENALGGYQVTLPTYESQNAPGAYQARPGEEMTKAARPRGFPFRIRTPFLARSKG